MKVRLKGEKAILSKLETRLRRMKNNSEYIFEKPLKPIIQEIKRNLIKDNINPENYSHVFTGKLIRNTRYEATNIFTGGTYDFVKKIKLGYFVDYGLDLEIGSNPKKVPISTLFTWSLSKPEKPNPYKVQRKILDRGTTAYPIILPVFNKNYDIYLNTVLDRIKKQWR